MNKQSWLLNLSLLKTHPAFRAVFLARFISIVSLGLLGVAVPVQIQMMTHSTWQVGLSVTLTGGAMFVGLMVGGVLADRYERKKVILLARGTCGIGFIGLCLNALLPEPSTVCALRDCPVPSRCHCQGLNCSARGSVIAQLLQR